MTNENKKPATFSDRVSSVENSLEELQKAVVKTVSDQSKTLELLVENIRQALAVQKEVIDIVVEELDSRFEKTFKPNLNTRLEAFKLEKLNQISQQEKAQIKAAVDQGILAQAESVDIDSVVVGVPSKEGKVLGAGRVTFEVSSLDANVSETVMGQGVGFKWETPDGSTVEISEIYKKLPPKPIEVSNQVEEK